MSKRILNIVDDIINQYILDISNTYDISKEELLLKWKQMDHYSLSTTTHSNFNVKTIENTTTNLPSSKKTGYQIFFSLHRNELKKKCPQMSYSEMTKEISNQWNKMNASEKNQYSSEMLPPMQKFTFDELNEKKMSELKEICEKYGIKKGGNKSELIKNLLGQTNTEEKANKVKLGQSMTIPTNDLSVELYMAKGEDRIDFQQEDIENEYESENDDTESKESDVSESSISSIEDDFDV